MKHLKVQFFKKYNNRKFKIILMFIVILPLISIIFGNLIAKYFIIPFTKQNSAYISNDTKSYDIKPASTNSHTYSYYYIQTGAFTNRNNAEILLKAMKNIDISSSIVDDNGMYKVIAGIFNNKDFENIKGKLKQYNFDFIVKEITIYDVSGNDDFTDKINVYIKSVCDIINLQIQINNMTSHEIDRYLIENLHKSVEGIMEAFSSIELYYKDKQVIKNFNVNNDILIKNIQEYIKYLEKDDKKSGFENLAKEIFALKSLYDCIASFK